MTKLRNILGICMIAILIVAGIYYVSASSVPSPAGQIASLSARKEDLLANQARIEDQLAALNVSMAQATQQQEALTAQITTLSAKLDVPVELPKPVVATPPAPVKPATPVPVQRRPVTRAS